MAKIAITTPMQRDFDEAVRTAGLRSGCPQDKRALRSYSRNPHLIELRRRVATVLREKGYSLNEIGALLGYDSHASVINLLATKTRDPREWVWHPDLGVWKPKPLPGRRAFERENP